MKNKHHLNWKQFCFAILIFILFLILTIFLFTYKQDEDIFLNVTNQLFQNEMTENTLNMHYTLAYPSNYGIKEYQAVLPCYDLERRENAQVELEKILSKISNVEESHLSKENQFTRALLLLSLSNTLSLNKYPYLDEPLSPSSGMQSQLPILLAEYTFRVKQDVEDYLVILSQTGEYFASLLQFEQEKKSAGLFMSTPSIEKVLKQCKTIITSNELEAGTHFLQTTFTERIVTIYEQEKISKEEAVDYIRQNNALLLEVLYPAYQSLQDGLSQLKDDSIPLSGLSAKENGKEYYQLLLVSETGSYRSVEDIRQLLLHNFKTEYELLPSIVQEIPLLTEASYASMTEYLSTSFPYQTASQMLSDLQERMEEDFPPIAVQEDSQPTVQIKEVSDNLEEYSAPAFYLTPPLDDTTTNVIYINEKNSPSGLDLYTTLAHEGYPGHLYQSVYSNRNLMSQNINPIRQILWYGGFQEGWALYVEFQAYDYASNLLTEHNQKDAASLIQLEKHNRNLQLCLLSLLDIMIHYDNASYKDIVKTLNSFGITDTNSIYSIYEYIVEEPTNYLKYYLGYLEILSLQEEAQKLWGTKYSDYQFHTFLLNNGPADFQTLHNLLSSTSS